MPMSFFRFNIADKLMSAYMGITGYLENNSYASITEENPFIIPGLYVANTNHPYIIYGGLDGLPEQ
jgi:hypothetical protein